LTIGVGFFAFDVGELVARLLSEQILLPETGRTPPGAIEQNPALA